MPQETKKEAMNQQNETLSFKAEPALAEQLRSIAHEQDRPLSWVIRKAATLYVESVKGKKYLPVFVAPVKRL